MLDTKTIEQSRKLEGREKIIYGLNLINEFEKLEQEGHIKIIDKRLDTSIGILTIDTFDEGITKAKKSRYRPKGYRKGNIVYFSLGMNHGNIIIETKEGNKIIYFEVDVFLKCKLWKYTWNVELRKNKEKEDNWYAVTGKKYMHRIIKGCMNGEKAIEGMDIDHINHDGLNNRLENIRIATRQENVDNKDTILGILHNKETGMYEYNDWISTLYFDEFGIDFNIDYPEPEKDFLVMQGKVKEFQKEYERANKELRENPDYIKYLENQRKELDNYIKERLQEDTGQATRD